MNDWKPDCEKCGLCTEDNQPVPDDGGDYTILVTGESPGEEEVKQGKPFVGKSGHLLRSALDQLGYPMEKVTFTNIVKCHPPNNDTKAKHVRCCYRSLPIRDNTKLVLLLGNVPLKAVLGETGITTWSGVRVDKDGVTYVPVVHPAYFLHRHDKDALDGWLLDLADALEAYRSGSQKSADADYEYVYPILQEEIEAMFHELAESEVISFDTEFSYLDAFHPENRLLAVSFANDHKAWAIPIDHDSEMRTDKPYIKEMLKELLESHPAIIGHNIKMDQLQMDVLAGIKFDAAGDTMLASFIVQTERGLHSLKRLAGYYLGMFEYDSELQEYVSEHVECDWNRGGSYANVPLDLLLPYAARDAAATYLLEPILLEQMTEKQQDLYYDLRMPASNALYRMTRNGIAVDFDIADRYQRLYTQAMEEAFERIQHDAKVERYVKERKAELTGVAQERFEFNPRSFVQKGDVLYGEKYYNLEVLETTDTGSPSTSKSAIEPHRAECPLVEDLLRVNTLGKMLGTYIEPIALKTRLSGDGRARSSFNQHVAVTGRLSSSGFNRTLGFNLQNIPNPDRVKGTILEYQPIKSMLTHTWEGGKFVSIDYSGMEIRVLACLSHCQKLLEYISEGRDVHTMVAAMIYDVAPEAVTHHQRTLAKAITFALQYGGSAQTIANDTGIGLLAAEYIMTRYFTLFPEVKEYMHQCIAFAQKNGYIETPFGLRRPLPDINSPDYGKRSHAEREAVNTPVQGGAGMLMELAVAIIDMEMQDRGFQSMLVNTVHDSICTDVYPGELENVIEWQVDIMEHLPHFAKMHGLQLDLSWIICPLEVDVEVGTHYGMLESYEIERAVQ